MAIPDYQTMMLPILRFASDGAEHASSEPIGVLAEQFSLTDEERQRRTPSGGMTLVGDRVHWSLSYMRQAGLLQSTRHGFFKITQRGLDVIATNPAKIDIKFLAQYPEFQEFRHRSRKPLLNETSPSANGSNGAIDKSEEIIVEKETPRELIEDAYQRIRVELAQTLLDRIKASSPAFFERLIVELLIKMGYGGSRKDAGEAIGQSGDDGIDGIIREDRLGLDTIYLQAKRWAANTVGQPDIQQFVGALSGKHARKGIYITTSKFSLQARNYVSSIEAKVILIDGEQLAEYMIDYDVGVATTSTYQIKHIDSDYFTEE